MVLYLNWDTWEAASQPANSGLSLRTGDCSMSEMDFLATVIDFLASAKREAGIARSCDVLREAGIARSCDVLRSSSSD